MPSETPLTWEQGYADGFGGRPSATEYRVVDGTPHFQRGYASYRDGFQQGIDDRQKPHNRRTAAVISRHAAPLRAARLVVITFCAISFLLVAWTNLILRLGIWKVALLLLAPVFAGRSLRKSPESRTNIDEVVLIAAAFSAIILAMVAWEGMGGGWLFVFGVALVIYAFETLRSSRPKRE